MIRQHRHLTIKSFVKEARVLMKQKKQFDINKQDLHIIAPLFAFADEEHYCARNSSMLPLAILTNEYKKKSHLDKLSYPITCVKITHTSSSVQTYVEAIGSTITSNDYDKHIVDKLLHASLNAGATKIVLYIADHVQMQDISDQVKMVTDIDDFQVQLIKFNLKKMLVQFYFKSRINYNLKYGFFQSQQQQLQHFTIQNVYRPNSLGWINFYSNKFKNRHRTNQCHTKSNNAMPKIANDKELSISINNDDMNDITSESDCSLIEASTSIDTIDEIFYSQLLDDHHDYEKDIQPEQHYTKYPPMYCVPFHQYQHQPRIYHNNLPPPYLYHHHPPPYYHPYHNNQQKPLKQKIIVAPILPINGESIWQPRGQDYMLF